MSFVVILSAMPCRASTNAICRPQQSVILSYKTVIHIRRVHIVVCIAYITYNNIPILASVYSVKFEKNIFFSAAAIFYSDIKKNVFLACSVLLSRAHLFMCVCVCTVYTASINADISVYTTAALVAIKKYRKKKKNAPVTPKQMSGAARIAHGHVHKLRVLMMVYKKKQIIRQTESTAMRPHRDDDAQRLFNEIKLRTLCVCVFLLIKIHTPLVLDPLLIIYTYLYTYILIYIGVFIRIYLLYVRLVPSFSFVSLFLCIFHCSALYIRN